jgi:hypothetical protein
MLWEGFAGLRVQRVQRPKGHPVAEHRKHTTHANEGDRDKVKANEGEERHSREHERPDRGAPDALQGPRGRDPSTKESS